jgi:NADH/NAD ratio-sensing transcriptional regulator Rex
MGGLTKSRAKLYLEGLLRSKRKHINTSDLAQTIGIVEDFIRDELSFLEPMVRLDLDYNLMDLMPQLEAYLAHKVERKKSLVKTKPSNYQSIAEFVYKNMTVSGGIIDSGFELDDQQLKDLKKLVNEAIKVRRLKSKG